MMKIKNIKTYYTRNLPHIQPVGATFFVTFRLKGSIPQAELKQLEERYQKRVAAMKKGNPVLDDEIHKLRKYFLRYYDELLDKNINGPYYLKQAEIAEIVIKELHRRDGELYNLMAYTIMSNHVHILIDTSVQLPDFFDASSWLQLDFTPLEHIMKLIKGASARYANLALNRKGAFWQAESYDYYVRDELELGRIIAYIMDNPVKAGIVNRWQDFPYSYVSHDHGTTG